MKKLGYTFLCIWVLTSVGSCKSDPQTTTTSEVPIQIKTAAVQQGDIKEYITFNGVTLYQKKENVRSNVTGYVSWLPHKLGSHIRAGQTFATVRTKEQDALAEAVRIDSTLAKLSGPISVISNGTGVIAQLNVQRNDYVAEGDVLAIISEPSSLVVQVNVPYEYGDHIDIGTLCEIMLQNGTVIQAKISAILPVIDPIPQSQQFLIELPGQELPENLNVQVKTVYKEKKNAMTIPHSALQSNELLTDFWVMKVLGDTLAVRQDVQTGLKNDSLIEVMSKNLGIHDKVVTEGSYQMQDSTKVSIEK